VSLFFFDIKEVDDGFRIESKVPKLGALRSFEVVLEATLQVVKFFSFERYRSHILYCDVALDGWCGVSCISFVFTKTEVFFYVAKRWLFIYLFIYLLSVRYILSFIIFNFRQ
jgi:hypothetical protein